MWLLCQEYCLVGKSREGTVSCSESFNVMAEQAKGNLPVYSVYKYWDCMVEIQIVGSLFKLSFKSEGYYWKSEENSGFFSSSVDAVCPHLANLHYCILSKQVSFSFFMVSQ